MKHRFRTAALALASSTALVLAVAGTASAHVTIDTLGEATPGEFAKIAFSVPNERDDAGTVKVEVQMPKDHPLAFVSTKPMPGWEVTVTRRDLDTPIDVEGSSITSVVDTVTWTATGDTKLEPGQFDQFWLSVGPLPDDVDSLGFPTLQTYDSGEVVSWIEPTPSSGEEPEHPLPTLGLSGEAGHGHGSSSTDSSDSSGSDSNVVAIIAVVVAGLALVIGGVAFLSGRKRSEPSA